MTIHPKDASKTCCCITPLPPSLWKNPKQLISLEKNPPLQSH